MSLFKNMSPFELEKSFSDILLKYTLISHITKDNKMYLLIDNDIILDDSKYIGILKSLKRLKEYGYIKDYKRLNKVGKYYRELVGSKKMVQLEKHNIEGQDKDFYFVIYHNKNKEKWNFIYNFATNIDSNINIHYSTIDDLHYYLSEYEKEFFFYFKKIMVKFGEFLPLKIRASNQAIEDFLIFLANKSPKELNKFHKEVKIKIVGFDYSSISITQEGILDKKRKLIVGLTKTEFNILKTLEYFNSHGGISKENINKSTKQTKDGFTQALKVLRKKIKNEELERNIIIKYNYSEKVYKLKIKE